MKLSLLMYGFYWLFFWTARTSGEFRQKLLEKDVMVTMTSGDSGTARTYVFNNGGVSTFSGTHPDAGCRLVWSTQKDGADVMMAIARGKSRALMHAVMDGRLMLEGDAGVVTWYMAVVALLGRQYRHKRRTR